MANGGIVPALRLGSGFRRNDGIYLMTAYFLVTPAKGADAVVQGQRTTAH